MADSPALHAIVLTLNEEQHLERCLQSILPMCTSVLVVDSGSSDHTVQIALRYGAEVLESRFVNHAVQLNLAIAHLAGRGGWLVKVDADEVLLSSPQAVGEALSAAPACVGGLLVRRRIHFMGRPLTWGGMDPIWQLRIWREGQGFCEHRWMDEHVIVQSEVRKTPLRIDDINLSSLSVWTEKHNRYASREAIDILASETGERRPRVALTGQARLKRMLKTRVYLVLPAGARAILYFIYRYVLRLGLLDGREGFYFHLLQALWYRTLVDAKVQEIRDRVAKKNEDIEDAIAAVTGVNLQRPAAPPSGAIGAPGKERG